MLFYRLPAQRFEAFSANSFKQPLETAIKPMMSR
jgi:hypothetical protein